MADIQSATAEIKRGKKKKKPQDENIMVCPFDRATIINLSVVNMWTYKQEHYANQSFWFTAK